MKQFDVLKGMMYLLFLVFFSLSVSATEVFPYKDTDLAAEKRIKDLITRMTLEEKISLLVGDAVTSLDTVYNERLQIPRLSMTDGPHGASFSKHVNKGSVCFPVGINMASTWNQSLIYEFGTALAEETLAEGRNVILGPCMNIIRTPLGGRNFEAFSEDPWLSSRMAVSYTKGVQDRNVIACPKHYACNNQEWHRMYVSAEVSERALREIYFPAYKASVQEANAYSMMAAYNKLNGKYACANKWLLTDVLKEEWGFKGIVISDWGAVHSTIDTAMAGCDLEMGGTRYMAEPLLEAVKAGQVPETVIDDKIYRILWVMMETGIFDQPWKLRTTADQLHLIPEPEGVFEKSMYGQVVWPDKMLLDSPGHRAVALEVARESITLLKNDKKVLPLNKERIKSVAVLGPNAWSTPIGGGGSSEVIPTYSVSALEGILKKCGSEIEVKYAMGSNFDRRYNVPVITPDFLRPKNAEPGQKGLYAEYFNNNNLEGEPALTKIDNHVIFHWLGDQPAPEINAHDFSVRWSGQVVAPHTGVFRFYPFRHGAFYANEQGDGVRLYLNGKCVIDDWQPKLARLYSADLKMEKGQSYDLVFEYRDPGPDKRKRPIAILGWRPYDNDIEKAAELASKTDAAIVCVGYNQFYHGENNDQGNLFLPADQEALIREVSAVNANTVVVLYNGNPVLMQSWVDEVPSILEAWYPGQEGGHALADILFGDTNPSGKLPVTFGLKREDYPDYGNYPGDGETVKHAEGIYVGYRHFDKQNFDVQYPFGHGLSYTSFKYSGLKVKPSQDSSCEFVVTFKVKNTGKRDGSEVAQVYVNDIQSSIDRPEQELRAFEKVHLKAGHSKVIRLKLDKRAFSYFHPQKKQWITEPGKFTILVGSSSRDIRLKKIVTLQ